MSEYIADQSWPDEAQRLRELERALDAHSQRYLLALGLEAGRRCLEIGAGSGSIARYLAERVGSAGHVLATDLDTSLIEQLAHTLRNVEVRRESIAEQVPEAAGSYDLAHARLVLGHIARPERALANIFRALAPGGWVLVEDVDFLWSELGSQPIAPERAQEPYFRVWREVVAHMAERGYAVHWGRKAAGALRDAGFEDVAGEAVTLIGSRALQAAMRLTIARFGAELVSARKIAEAELRACLEVLDDPAITFTGSPMFSVWGRRPRAS